jgi:hypothetical protein
VDVRITDAGFLPASINLAAGGSVHLTNETIQPQSVTSTDGLFDSGPIAPGGGFSIALAVPGNHAYTSSANPALTGAIQVLLTTLNGPPGDLASSHIPLLDFPPHADGDMVMDAALGVEVARTRIIVLFTRTATVAQANAALATAGVTIIGGSPREAILLVAAPDTPDLSGLHAALQALQAAPAVL